MAGLPHFRNSQASMNKFEPVYLTQFEILLTPPPAVGGWDLVMEQVLKVGGLEVNKQPGQVTQKYKSASRTFSAGFVDDTTITVSIDFEVNLDDSNSMYVYKALRKWTDIIYDPLTGRMGLKKDYTGGPMIINQFNKNGDIFRQIKMAQVFPISPLPVMDLDYSASDIYRISSFQFKADYFEETIL